ncbi:putative ribonuclease H-like domain-containing protein [Tanacetum coccineum]
MDNTGIFGNAYDNEDVEEEIDMNNVNSSYTVPNTSFTKFHKDHPKDQVIGSLKTPVQTRHITKITEEHGLISLVHQLRITNHKDFQKNLFAYFLSQKEPKKELQALEDPSWVEAMQNELLQLNNKVLSLNKARLVAQGHTQEEGIDYDEVFAPIARIEAIRLFLAYASFKKFIVYQMDVKSAFLYGKIEEESNSKGPQLPSSCERGSLGVVNSMQEIDFTWQGVMDPKSGFVSMDTISKNDQHLH